MKISSEKFYTLLYFLCIIVSFFSNYELTFLVWLFAILVSYKEKYSLTIIKLTIIFSLIIVIACLSKLFYTYPVFNSIKDFTYLLKPILGLLVGYQLYDKVSNKGMKTFIYAGLLLALIHVFLIVLASYNFRTLNMNIIRMESGFFSDYEVYVLLLLLFHKKFDLEMTKFRRNLLIAILSFSIFMYFSRTNFLQFFILLLGIKGYYILTPKSLRILLGSILILSLGYASIYYSNPKRNGKGLEGLMYKIKISPQEAFKTRINKEDWRDFNDNYRSYENILSVKEVQKDGIRTILFGKGIGSTMNIGQKIYTTDGSIIQNISIAHNGFMTILLKSGLVGVVLLLLTIVLLYRQKKSNIPIVNTINLLLIGTSIFLIVSYWVFMGLYFKLDNKSVIIGFFIAMRECILKKNQTPIEIVE